MTEQEVAQSIEAALATWDRTAVQARVDEATALREEFVAQFPIDAWPNLPIESYALGQQVDGGTVCGGLSSRPDTLGV